MSANPPPLPRQSRRRILPLIIVGVCLLPLAALLIWFVSYRWSNAAAVHRLETKARNNGEPLTLAELAATYPPIPDEQNGAVLLLRAWEKDDPAFWQAFQNGAQSLPTLVQRKYDPLLPFLGSNAKRIQSMDNLSPASLKAADDYLYERAQHLAEVRAALNFPQFRFPLLITNGFATLLPHLAAIKAEAQNFAMEALIASERGDVDSSLEALKNTSRMGRTLAREPFLISQLVRIACCEITLTSAERLLSKHALSDKQLNNLAEILNQMQISGNLRTTMIAERACDLSAFNLSAAALAQADSDSDPGSQPARYYYTGMGVLNLVGLKDLDERLMLETMEQVISLRDENTPESLAQFEEAFSTAAFKARQFPPKLFSAMLLPGLQKAGERFARHEARRRAAETAIAVERFRAVHQGQLPQQLNELTPQFLTEIPTDPFDGEAIRFKPQPIGFAVYSIGANRVDDGGKERPEKTSVKDFDETFIIER
jgi:hypothetical protein